MTIIENINLIHFVLPGFLYTFRIFENFFNIVKFGLLKLMKKYYIALIMEDVANVVINKGGVFFKLFNTNSFFFTIAKLTLSWL